MSPREWFYKNAVKNKTTRPTSVALLSPQGRSVSAGVVLQKRYFVNLHAHFLVTESGLVATLVLITIHYCGFKSERVFVTSREDKSVATLVASLNRIKLRAGLLELSYAHALSAKRPEKVFATSAGHRENLCWA